jgi:putative DNA primase/helicase
MRHCHAWKKWLLYRGGYWQLDDAGIALARSKHVARLILTEAASCEDKAVRTALIEHSHRTEKAERRKAMVDLARCESRIPILHTQLDRHPYLLNCANGTLDLETFKKHDHRASDYLTKQCPTAYVPDAQCPLWLQTIERVLPDERVRAYLQRYFGYALTGDVSEQVLLTALGVGANGKSTIMCTIQDVLSSAYAIQIATDMLLTKDRESHPTDLADLFGVRLAIGTETPKGRALDERLVKQLTGGEPIRARRMREDFWEFPPSHKFILVTNHMPEVSADDYAVTRRLHVLRFDVTIPEADRDKQLLRKLKREREGILAWAVEGRRMQLEQGLAAPDEVLFKPSTATETKSPPEEFIASFVVRQPGSRTRASVLFDAYTSWCGRNNKPIASQQDFGSMLGRLGFGSKKSEGVIVYVDTLLRPDREDQGPQGPLLPLNVLSTPREGVNGESGPSHPYSSLKRSRRIEETASECVLSQLRAGTCYTCGGMRFWRARDGTHWTCGTCAPPSKDLADPVWSDGASHA